MPSISAATMSRVSSRRHWRCRSTVTRVGQQVLIRLCSILWFALARLDAVDMCGGIGFRLISKAWWSDAPSISTGGDGVSSWRPKALAMQSRRLHMRGEICHFYYFSFASRKLRRWLRVRDDRFRFNFLCGLRVSNTGRRRLHGRDNNVRETIILVPLRHESRALEAMESDGTVTCVTK